MSIGRTPDPDLEHRMVVETDKSVDIMHTTQVETVEGLQSQYIDKMVREFQVPMIQKLQNILEGLQIQYIDKVVRDVELPMVQKLHKTVDGLQTHYIDKVVRMFRCQ